MHIPLSEKTNELIFEIKDFSGKEFKNFGDLGALIEITAGSGDTELFDELIFNGKYANGMKKVLDKDVSISDDAKEKIITQFQGAVESLIRTIQKAVKDQDAELQSYFEAKYLILTQESISNLVSLSEDLAVCKEYFNSLK
ncbi:MAG TPA: hypothetical protein VK004_00230 [Ignavibacteria bacterium]|nr:hypothetical protein [Ignavibacteria bacterium]